MGAMEERGVELSPSALTARAQRVSSILHQLLWVSVARHVCIFQDAIESGMKYWYISSFTSLSHVVCVSVSEPVLEYYVRCSVNKVGVCRRARVRYASSHLVAICLCLSFSFAKGHAIAGIFKPREPMWGCLLQKCGFLTYDASGS